jgi:predicted dehydrogenase
MNRLRIGIVGANPDRGWASRAHVPAIAGSPEFVLSAVATSRRESAEAARQRFGARHAFTSAQALSAHPDVDVVVVTVKVAAHRELVEAALAAGKHVYCEWPLALSAAEAADLTAMATAAGVRAVVGLQARFAPAVVQARAMIAAGRLGEIRAATLYGARAKGHAVEVPASTEYTYDAAQRAGLVDVLGGHSLDLIEHMLGPIVDLHTRTAIRSPHHSVAETGAAIDVTAADHLLAIGTLRSGALVSVHLRDGEVAEPRTRLEIAGSEGNLSLVSGGADDPWAAQLQIDDLRLSESRRGQPSPAEVELPDDAASALRVQARNVARLYTALAADIADGGHRAPTFSDAVALHRLLDDVHAHRE